MAQRAADYALESARATGLAAPTKRFEKFRGKGSPNIRLAMTPSANRFSRFGPGA